MWKVIASTLLITAGAAVSAQQAPQTKIDLDSLAKANWSEQELANVRLVGEFVQKLMNDHDFDYVLKHFSNSRYTQHNRNLPDKMEGLVGFLDDFVKDYPDYSYDVKHIYADGDYVIFHSHATLKREDRGNDQKGMNIIDSWKIKDGEIVEHWDSIQALDGFMRFYSLISGGNIRNDNGVF